jgi:hypothetical protein
MPKAIADKVGLPTAADLLGAGFRPGSRVTCGAPPPFFCCAIDISAAPIKPKKII